MFPFDNVIMEIVNPAHRCTHSAHYTTRIMACHLPWHKIFAWRLFYRNLRKADPLPLRRHASIINAVLVAFGLYFPYTTASWGTYPRNICILDGLWYMTVIIFLSTHNSPEGKCFHFMTSSYQPWSLSVSTAATHSPPLRCLVERITANTVVSFNQLCGEMIMCCY